jgi:hypothetical protein
MSQHPLYLFYVAPCDLPCFRCCISLRNKSESNKFLVMWRNYWEHFRKTISSNFSRHGNKYLNVCKKWEGEYFERNYATECYWQWIAFKETATLIFTPRVCMVTIISCYELLILIFRTVQDMSVSLSFSNSSRCVSSFMRNIRVHFRIMTLYSIHATISLHNQSNF